MADGDPQRQLLPVVARFPGRGMLLDVGPQTRSQIKRLKRGRGRLTRQIAQAVGEASEELGIDAAAEVVPVVILYRRGEDYQVHMPTPDRAGGR
jgi:hypothetical protein